MKGLTIFTVMLTVVVVAAVSDVLVNDYLPKADEVISDFKLPDNIDLSETLTTSVLAGSELLGDLKDEVLPAAEKINEEVVQPISRIVSDNVNVVEPEVVVVSEDPGKVVDFESVGGSNVQAVSSSNVLIREDQLRPAGYLNSYLEQENFDGKIFKSIEVGDLRDIEVTQSVVRTDAALLTRVYVVRTGINANINDVYETMKVRANAGASASVNETNDFGIKSFYMNDDARGNTAFLTVRISNYIYSFSYPKDYHAQVKNLIQLLVWEFS